MTHIVTAFCLFTGLSWGLESPSQDTCYSSPSGEHYIDLQLTAFPTSNQSLPCTAPEDHLIDFLLLTIATEETDGYKRFIRTTKLYNVPTQVLGLGEDWKGGDMLYAGGGHKVIMLREGLKPYAQDEHKIIMFSDSYDAIVLAPPTDILEQFLAADTQVVFAAELYCYPDESLADKYPVTVANNMFQL